MTDSTRKTSLVDARNAASQTAFNALPAFGRLPVQAQAPCAVISIVDVGTALALDTRS
jgi:hypothetical protein